jgi:nitronate monooxygenase
MSHSLQHLVKGLTSRFPWISAPLIVGAPMRVLGGPKLAVSVSAAQGLGFIGPAPETKNMKDDLEEARRLIQDTPELRHKLSVESSNHPPSLPIGVGFQLWSDDLATATQLIQQYRPCVAWLYAPKDAQKDYVAWSSAFRRAFPDIAIWIQVGTVAEVRQLLGLPELPDAIVVQGAEAGGHGRAEDGIGLMTLLPEVTDLLRKGGHDIPLLAAGGIVDGRGGAAAFCLGANGIAMGTRFLAATEARISRGYQQEIVRANDGGVITTRTLLYNQLRGTVGWPKNYAPRTIINRSYLDYISGVPFENLQTLHDEALGRGDQAWGPEGRVATYAGASVGLIHDIRDAGSLVRDTRRDTVTILGAFQGTKL